MGSLLGKKGISKNDLFYHYAHGLYRVFGISKPSGDKESVYTLVPVEQNKANTRFLINKSGLGDSGFNKMISVEETQAVLEYFRSGKKKLGEESHVWTFAEVIFDTASKEELVKATQKRMELDRAMRGLVGQLAFILDLTVKQMAEKVKDSLNEQLDVINPYVSRFLDTMSRNKSI